MIEIAKLSADDRRELFHNTAAKIGLNDAIIEKDFWVCLTLDYLFHRSPWKEAVTFKGGTSLSKGYHLISRFSEDIDLILDWRVLGYRVDEPWEKSLTPNRMRSIKRPIAGQKFSYRKIFAHGCKRIFLSNWGLRSTFT